jgi:hypothetical protein
MILKGAGVATNATSDHKIPFALGDVSAEVVKQHLPGRHEPVASTTPQETWDQLQLHPNLHEFVTRKALELAPVDLDQRSLAIRAMVEIIGLLHQDQTTRMFEVQFAAQSQSK